MQAVDAQRRLRFRLSRTQSRFCKSSAEVVVLIGPQGEGKTYGGFASMFYHASRQPEDILPIRCAIIRDTLENIKSKTVPSILEACMRAGCADAVRFSDGYKKMQAEGIDCDLFGIDDLPGLSKLQGSEYALVWIEEPAPIIMGGSAGIMEEVFDVGYSRLRGAWPYKRLQISMNPAHEEHWTYRRFVESPAVYDGHVLVTEVFNIPYGENIHLSQADRERTRRAYERRPDLSKRYVEGQWGYVVEGEPVIGDCYNEQIQRAPGRLDPIPGVEGLRFWDGGLNPSCVIAQMQPGRLTVLDTIVGQNMGMRQMIRTLLLALLANRYRVVRQWRDLGDASLCNREQSDSSITAAGIIEEELRPFSDGPVRFEPGEQSWEVRREAMKNLLGDMSGGQARFILSRHERILHEAFRGGWHYKKDASGRVLRDIPVKNLASNPCDALSHGVAVLLPWKPQIKLPRQAPNLARSYAIR